jgi:hypothetical protein
MGLVYGKHATGRDDGNGWWLSGCGAWASLAS